LVAANCNAIRDERRLAMGAEEAGKKLHSMRFLKNIPILIISVVVLGATLSAAIVTDRHVSITLTGVVTDSLCGGDHGIKALGDPECTRTCVALGAQYALAAGRKIYVLQGHELDLDRFAGSEVRVKGRTAGRDRVIVDQVEHLYTEAAAGTR
jgi:hypothetical protein